MLITPIMCAQIYLINIEVLIFAKNTKINKVKATYSITKNNENGLFNKFGSKNL